MKRNWKYVVASICVVFACNTLAAVGWEENFNPLKPTWNEVSAIWTDLAGPTAKITESDPVNSYGVASSEVITLDVSVYSELVITSTAIDPGALYSIQIQEAVEGGAYANAVSFCGVPGTQVVNIAALMGWSGTKSFVINIWIEGESKSVTFGLLQLRQPTATEGWTENFDPIKSTWAQASATWTDEAGPTATLTESDPINSYGVAGTEVITLNVSDYNELVVSSVAMTGSYSIQIQEVGGAGIYKDAASYISEPSTHVVNIAKLMGWSGVKSFKINIWIDGESKSVTFGLIQIRKALPGQSGWAENFNPIKPTWVQGTCHWTDTPGPNSVLTVTPNSGEWWGCASSEIITLDVNVYDEIYVKTTAVESGCLYTVQIQQVGGGAANAVAYMGVPSENHVNLKELMGWSGVKSFRIFIWLDCGLGGHDVTFNAIQIRNSQPSGKPNTIFWQDNFDPILSSWNEIPDVHAYWTDLPGSYATLTEDNPYDNYGKVESETLLVNLNLYPELAFKVVGVDAGGRLDIGIQGQGDPWPYFDVATFITGPTTMKVNIADITGWTGYQQLRIVLWMNGNNKSATFDYIKLQRVCGTGVLAGDYNDDCKVDLFDLAQIGQSWMSSSNWSDMRNISNHWLEEAY